MSPPICQAKKFEKFFREKYHKSLATRSAFVLLCRRAERLTTHPTTTMILPFPADSAEFEEYTSAMEELADLAEASAPDPEPSDMGDEDEVDHWDSDPQDEEYWASRDNWDEGPEDRYLDTYWEDQSEYGMEGCCGDF